MMNSFTSFRLRSRISLFTKLFNTRMFGPVGGFIPSSVIADIGVFLNTDKIHECSLLSPRANNIFKKNRMLHHDTVEIKLKKAKLTVKCAHRADLEVVNREMEINLDKEDPVGKLSLLLSMSKSIDEFSWYGCVNTQTLWHIDEQLLKLMFNIKIKKMILCLCQLNVSLPIFVKFIHLHGNILETCAVKLHSELISNKTLRMIAEPGFECINGIDPVVDVNDDFLEQTSSVFHLSNCSTQITIKGIRTFREKIETDKISNSFGTLGSDQLMDAITFEEECAYDSRIELSSVNGHKTLLFDVINHLWRSVEFKISLDKRDEGPLGMLPIPQHFVGLVIQERFLHFVKICYNPDVQLPFNQYHMESLSLSWKDNEISISSPFENRPLWSYTVIQTNVDINAAHKIIFGVLKNCISIDRLIWHVPLTDDLYQMLKPISATIIMKERWVSQSSEIYLSSANVVEILKTKGGLFGAFNVPKPRAVVERCSILDF